jgi:hypothetical protein
MLWLDYGALLERSFADARARYVCIVKAQAALERVAGEHPERRRLTLVTSTIRAQLEERLAGDAVAQVLADVDGEADRALRLQYDLQSGLNGSIPQE